MAKYLVPIHFHGTVGNKTPLIDIMNRPGTQKSLLENTGKAYLLYFLILFFKTILAVHYLGLHN